jgi:phage FluMu protein gp41
MKIKEFMSPAELEIFNKGEHVVAIKVTDNYEIANGQFDIAYNTGQLFGPISCYKISSLDHELEDGDIPIMLAVNAVNDMMKTQILKNEAMKLAKEKLNK